MNGSRTSGSRIARLLNAGPRLGRVASRALGLGSRVASRFAIGAACALLVACGPGPVGDIVPRPEATPAEYSPASTVEPGGGGKRTPNPSGTRKAPKPTRTPTPAPGGRGGGPGSGGPGGGGPNGPRPGENAGEGRRTPRPTDGRPAQPPREEGQPNGGHGGAVPGAGKPSASEPTPTPAPSSDEAPLGSAVESTPPDAAPSPDEAASPDDASAPDATPAPEASPTPAESARTLPFTEAEIERYLAAATALREKGLDRPGGPSPAEAEKFRADWSAILAEHGFDDPGYRKMNESVAWAFAASEMAGEGGIEATAAAAVEERLSSMVGVAPERLARLRDGMIAAERDKFRQYASVPASNLELARRFRERLAPLLGK